MTDISTELHLYRYGNGIKLIRPDQTDINCHLLHNTHHTVNSILSLPMNVYFIGADSINQKVNEQDALLSGFDSVKSAIGKTCFSQLTQSSADITTKNDKLVMLTQKAKISEENVVLSNGNISRPTLSIKLPWYDEDNKVVGLFGCSIILGRHPLADSLSLVKNLGILSPSIDTQQHVGAEINTCYLSKRQITCAKLVLAGMTQKQIATHLQLSPRTVENYIENTKIKLNCRNRTEFILKLHEIFKS